MLKDEPRLHAMDALRAAAALLVVMVHSALSYTVVRFPLWNVHDSPPSPFFDWLSWWILGFVMPLFFLIAGFWSASQYENLGTRAFLQKRSRRILLPLLLSLLIILPAIFYIWSAGWFLSGRSELKEILAVKFSDPHLRQGTWGPAHLWFLEYLFLITLVYAAVGKWRLFRLPESAVLFGWTPVLFAIPTTFIIWADYSVVFHFRNSFLPEPLHLLYHGLFFAAGVLVWQTIKRPESLIKFNLLYLVLTIPAFLCMAFLLKFYLAGELSISSRFLLSLATALFTWLSLFGWLGFALKFLNRPYPVIRQLSDASYWIYLFHMPVVGFVQVALYKAPIPSFVKFTAAISAGLAFSLWTYRRTAVGVLLEGRLSSRRLRG